MSEGGAGAGSFETAIEQAVGGSQAKAAGDDAVAGLIQALTNTQAKITGVLQALVTNESNQGETEDSIPSESGATETPEEKKETLLSALPEGLACNLLLQVTPDLITPAPAATSSEEGTVASLKAAPAAVRQSVVVLNTLAKPAEASTEELDMAAPSEEVPNQKAGTEEGSTLAKPQKQAATLNGKLVEAEVKEACENAAPIVAPDPTDQNEPAPAKPELAKSESPKSQTASSERGLARAGSRQVESQSRGDKLSPLPSEEGAAVQESSSDKLSKVATDQGSAVENKADALPKANQKSESASPSQNIQTATTPARKVESEPASDTPQTQAPEAGGTSTAKSTQTMQNTAETGQTLQSLPGKGAKTASLTQSIEPAQGKTSMSASGEAPAKPVSPRADISMFVQEPAQINAEAAKTVVSAKTPLNLEQVETQIQKQVVEFQRVGADSMSVVLKPDTHLELHLQLRLEQGQVHVVAECKRGDVAALNQTWAHLQQNLSGQGIRLAPLQDASGTNLSQGNWTSNFQSRDWQSGEQQQSFENDHGKGYRFFGDEAASTPPRGRDTAPCQPESKGARALNKSGEKRSLEWWA